jgi:molybdopterin synthase catalytic subunit
MQHNILISPTPLSVADCAAWAATPKCGGIDMFIGTVRNVTKGKAVVRLEFEAYESMALSEMQKLADAAAGKWPVHKVLIHHRVGTLAVGEIAVVIAVSSPHRDAAFEACRYLIDTLKQTVPIWKKEVFEDGEQWVAAHP